MLVWAVVALAVAAAIGVLMASRVLQDRDNKPPGWMVWGHGLAAAVGIGLLIYSLFENVTLPVGVGTGVLIFAALAGLVLLSMHNRGEDLALPVLITHGLFALAGFGLLLFQLYSSS